MEKTPSPIDTLQDIRLLMERSSRFISLSGWSGISAGTCALIGAWLAYTRINLYFDSPESFRSPELENLTRHTRAGTQLSMELLCIGAGVLIAALITSYFFTLRRSNQHKIPFWNTASRRMIWNLAIPLMAGGFLVLSLLNRGYFDLVAPTTLIFYGLALINASKFTVGEIRYLGICELILGVLNLWIFPQYSLFYWAAGFGVLHIVYGTIMWMKYERSSNPTV